MNHTMIQFFEWELAADSSHWKRCKELAASLAEVGFDAVWLPPAFKGADGINDVGYGVYDLYDLGEFDQKGSIPTKYGTKDEYIDAVKELQKRGLYVLGDIVLNHKMGADQCETVLARECAEYNRLELLSEDEEATVWTKFTFPGRKGKYSDFQWGWNDFDGTDWDEKAQRKGILLFQGKTWEEGTDKERANYDYLMGADVDVKSPRVRQELLDWGKWYLDTVGMDGFRIDAVKHIDSDFFTDWLGCLREHSGKEIFAVGEYWNSDLNALLSYLQASQSCMSLFDVPLHFHFYDASIGNGNFDMAQLFSNTLVGTCPSNAVTFVDNHDTQPGQALFSFVAPWFKPLAYASILLRKDGFPCVFYGDYYGIADGSAQPVALLPLLVKIRKFLAYGTQHDYLDDFNIIGWTREGCEEYPHSGIAVVLTDNAAGEKSMYMGTQFAGQKLYDCTFQFENPVVIDSEGMGCFPVQGGNLSIWVRKEALEILA